MISLLGYLKDRYQGKTVKGMRRSKHWPKVRKAHLEKQPFCQVCGTTESLEVHHIFPYHKFPHLELREGEEFLITLCDGKGKKGMKSCHLYWGHNGNWKDMNESVREEAEAQRKKWDRGDEWKM